MTTSAQAEDTQGALPRAHASATIFVGPHRFDFGLDAKEPCGVEHFSKPLPLDGVDSFSSTPGTHTLTVFGEKAALLWRELFSGGDTRKVLNLSLTEPGAEPQPLLIADFEVDRNETSLLTQNLCFQRWCMMQAPKQKYFDPVMQKHDVPYLTLVVTFVAPPQTA